MHPRQRFDQRRLTGSIVSKQTENLSSRNLERHILNGRDAPEGLGKRFRLEEAEVFRRQGRHRSLRAKCRKKLFPKTAIKSSVPRTNWAHSLFQPV